jgi:capsular polysaccharide transport system permease protein
MTSKISRNIQPLFGLAASVPRDGAPGQASGNQNKEPKAPASEGPSATSIVPSAHAAAGSSTPPNSAVMELPHQGNKIAADESARLPPQPETAYAQYVLPSLPGVKSRPAYGAYIGFAVCVLLPLLVATWYYTAVASDQYVAEFRFAVKDATANSMQQAGGLLALVGSVSGTSNSDNYLVTVFLTSREAIEELEKQIKVTDLYSKPTIDWWSRFRSSQPMESFLPYWQQMVTARYDQVTGLAVAEVKAFTPEDALLIAKTLVTLSEKLVNKIANRTQTDIMHFSEREVERAENRLKRISAQLMEYRNRTGVIDPNLSVAASNATLIQTLRANLVQLETQLGVLTQQNVRANSPVIETLKNQIQSTKDQLQKTEATVGHNRDGVPLSTVMAEYEQLDLERQFAQTMLTSARQGLDQARARAAAQNLYVTPYVQPHLPQSSIYPKRLLSIATVGLLAFVSWIIGLLIIRSIRERFA